MKKRITPLYGLLLAGASAWAQEKIQANPPAPSTPQQVTINGSQTDLEQSRDFVAGKLIIGRKQLAESGVQNVSEILKREPAISLGKNGQIGLLGLPGYTQILIDGKPAIGISPLELDVNQVDKIEIIKTSTAETGPFGIAGTINIIRRKIERKAFQQAHAGLAVVAGEVGVNGAWTYNQVLADSPFSWNLHISARRTPTPGSKSYEQILAAATPLQQYQGRSETLRTLQIFSLSSDFKYKFDDKTSVNFKPNLGQVTYKEEFSDQRIWSNGRRLTLQQSANPPLTGLELPFSWSHDAGERGQFESSLRYARSRLEQNDTRQEQDTRLRNAVRRHAELDEQTSSFLTLDYKNTFSGGHDLKAGLHLTHARHDMTRTDSLNDAPDPSLRLFGQARQIWQDKRRIYLQDDWRIQKNLAFNAGLSMEDSVMEINEGNTLSQSRYRVWSPSLHVSKKFDSDQKRRLRASLARSFQAPGHNQLMLNPRINPLAACSAMLVCEANTPDTSDDSGNPGLRPERALALNLAYEHGLSSDSQITLEFYAREIQGKIGQEIRLMNVPWSQLPRYLERPANLGQADVAGINLEWRLAARDFIQTAPKLDLRGSLGWAQSRMHDLPAPHNRLEGVSPWRAKLGASYQFNSLPIKLDVDASWLPGDWLRNNLTQSTYESRSRNISANASWNVNPKLRLVTNLTNLFAPDSTRLVEYRTIDATLQNRSQKTTYTQFGIRMELKL